MRPIIFILITLLMATSVAYGKIIRIEISSVESPAFGGKTFGAVGAYEKLRGKAYGELDPSFPGNALITDIALAPRNARGMVEYAMDIYILRPIDPAKGNHRLFVEIPNRGNKLFGGLDNSGGGNDPGTAEEAGEGFLMNKGYTLVWGGWDISAGAGHNNLTITVPIAHHPDGSVITGPSYEYISFDNPGVSTYRLTYPPATTDKGQATLTVRHHLDDPAQVIPADGWEYANDHDVGHNAVHDDGHSIRLLPRGAVFQQSDIYEFRYTAKDPLVAGIGLAATRDLISFLRYERMDAAGHANPLEDVIQHTFSFAVSQPARYMNDFETLGFNADEKDRRVFDGVENWLGGGSGVGINYRFAQTDRTERNRQNHLYPEAVFPFAYPTLTDPVTGEKAGRETRCRMTNTCPFAFEINSSNEYWVKAASLLHSDLQGRDLPDPARVRFYLISGMQHGTGNEHRMGFCQQLQNPTHAEPVLRALLVALDDWVTKGTSPPASRVPRHSNGTAAMAETRKGSLTGVVPQTALGWPSLPTVTYSGLITTRYRFDYGPLFSKGIISQYPVTPVSTPAYPCFVSTVDKDGNEQAGIRLPPVAVPTATLTGWALRRNGFGEGDGCESSGQYIPFQSSKKDRLTVGDPRLSLEERYGDLKGYVEAVKKAAQQLADERFLLQEDVERYIGDAEKNPGFIQTLHNNP